MEPRPGRRAGIRRPGWARVFKKTAPAFRSRKKLAERALFAEVDARRPDEKSLSVKPPNPIPEGDMYAAFKRAEDERDFLDVQEQRRAARKPRRGPSLARAEPRRRRGAVAGPRTVRAGASVRFSRRPRSPQLARDRPRGSRRRGRDADRRVAARAPRSVSADVRGRLGSRRIAPAGRGAAGSSPRDAARPRPRRGSSADRGAAGSSPQDAVRPRPRRGSSAGRAAAGSSAGRAPTRPPAAPGTSRTRSRT